jgi:hypothetical protein
VVLAQQYQYPQMEQLLARYANTMLEKDKVMDAIELYRKVRPRARQAGSVCSVCTARSKHSWPCSAMRSAHPLICWPCALCTPFFLLATVPDRRCNIGIAQRVAAALFRPPS